MSPGNTGRVARAGPSGRTRGMAREDQGFEDACEGGPHEGESHGSTQRLVATPLLLKPHMVRKCGKLGM